MLQSRAFRLALVCGALPLIVGLVAFTVWLATRWDGLMILGYFIILGGVGLFVTGLVALGIACRNALRAGRLPRQRIWLSTFACLGLLLVNFPVAAVLTICAVGIETSYNVLIQNDSPFELSEVRLVGGGCDEELGSIAAGETVERRFWIETDGELMLRAQVDGKPREELIEGYVTSGLGRRAIVTIGEDGQLSVVLER